MVYQTRNKSSLCGSPHTGYALSTGRELFTLSSRDSPPLLRGDAETRSCRFSALSFCSVLVAGNVKSPFDKVLVSTAQKKPRRYMYWVP